MRSSEADAHGDMFGARPRRSFGRPDNESSPLQRQIFERNRSRRATFSSDSQTRFGGDGWFDMSLEMIRTNLKPKFLRLLNAGKIKHVTGEMMRHQGETALGHKSDSLPRRLRRSRK